LLQIPQNLINIQRLSVDFNQSIRFFAAVVYSFQSNGFSDEIADASRISNQPKARTFMLLIYNSQVAVVAKAIWFLIKAEWMKLCTSAIRTSNVGVTFKQRTINYLRR